MLLVVPSAEELEVEMAVDEVFAKPVAYGVYALVTVEPDATDTEEEPATSDQAS
jgi:hypothetical protein